MNHNNHNNEVEFAESRIFSYLYDNEVISENDYKNLVLKLSDITKPKEIIYDFKNGTPLEKIITDILDNFRFDSEFSFDLMYDKTISYLKYIKSNLSDSKLYDSLRKNTDYAAFILFQNVTSKFRNPDFEYFIYNYENLYAFERLFRNNIISFKRKIIKDLKDNTSKRWVKNHLLAQLNNILQVCKFFFDVEYPEELSDFQEKYEINRDIFSIDLGTIILSLPTSISGEDVVRKLKSYAVIKGSEAEALAYDLYWRIKDFCKRYGVPPRLKFSLYHDFVVMNIFANKKIKKSNVFMTLKKRAQEELSSINRNNLTPRERKHYNEVINRY